MIFKKSICGNYIVTKDKSTKTCSGFVFTLHDVDEDGDLDAFHETGTFSIMEWFCMSNDIFFKLNKQEE